MSGFDWNNGDVVLRTYGSVAVHENVHGDIVVRQERDAMEEDDNVVVVPVHDAELVAQAIIDKAREVRRANQVDGKPEQQHLALPAPRVATVGTRALAKEGGHG